MRRKIVFFVLFVSSFWCLNAQKIKLPLEVKKGHLFSEWKINDSIKVRVMLETGFPKIVINEKFAKKHLRGLVKMKKAPDSMNIALWGTSEKQKISYLIKDSLTVNGHKIFIDAVVADMSSKWKNRDIVFPLQDLSEMVEINIKNRYMVIGENLKDISGCLKLKVKYDKEVKGLYLPTVLNIFDSLQKKESVKGNFLLDLGAPNAIYLNRDSEKIEKFIEISDRMVLKDTAKYSPKSYTKVVVLIPPKIRMNDIVLREEYIVALRLKRKKSRKYEGVIGNRFFCNFIVFFDFKKKAVYLKPISDKVRILR